MGDILNIGDLPENYEVDDEGNVLITDELDDNVAGSTFDVNLAEKLPSNALKSIASELCELVNKDKESRKKRDEQYEEGLRRTGLGDDAPGGAEFEGASKVVHPVLAEACVDFSARAIKELFPSQGPVKPFIAGEATPAKRDQAIRKARFFNWQLTEQIQEYRGELEQLLTQLPMGGSQYQKFWYDERLKRPGCAFVPVDEVLLPYAASNFYTSPRATHRQLITKYELQRRIKSGLYRDIFTPESGSVPEQTLSASANDKIEGREEDGYNEDGLRAILEIYVDYEVDGDELTDGQAAPYIVTIDEDTEEVFSVYRNWDEQDVTQAKLDWFVEWKFIPWRGVYGIGLPHLIGGLSAALTGALRALLDSAHINNAPTMLKLKSGRVVGQSKNVDVTQVCDIEGPAGIDDIRKLAMPMPFNQPSPVLMQLMGELYGLAKGVVATADEKLAQVGDRTPVGTTMSLIEQGSTIYSAIHARLHESQKRALAILQRIDRVYFDELNLTGYDADSINADDINLSPDVVPVSDPTIFSEAQRFAQVQSLVQMSADQSVPWNKVALYHRVLKQMRIEAPEEILPKPPQPVTAEAMQENIAALQDGMQLKANPQQDHQAHIQSHMMAINVPWVLQNEFVPPQAIGMIAAHINEHLQQMVTAAVMNTAQQLTQAMAMQGQQVTPEQASVMAQQQVMQTMGQMIQGTMQQLGQIMEVVKQRTPPPPLPPEVQASIQIAQMEIQRKTAADQAGQQVEQIKMQAKQQLEGAQLQMKQAEAQFEQQVEQARFAMEQRQQQVDQQLDQMRLQQDQQVEQLKQQVELMKNQRDNEQKQTTELQKNQEDNETSLLINQMREEAAKERALMVEMLKQMSQPEVQLPDIAPQLQELVKLFEELGSAQVTIIGEHHGQG